MKAKKVYEFRTSGEIVSMGKDYYKNKFIKSFLEEYNNDFQIKYDKLTNTIIIDHPYQGYNPFSIVFTNFDNNYFKFDINIEAPNHYIKFINSDIIGFDENITINAKGIVFEELPKLINLPKLNSKRIILKYLPKITKFNFINWEKLNYFELNEISISEIPIDNLNVNYINITRCNKLIKLPNNINIEGEHSIFTLFNNDIIDVLPEYLNASIADIGANPKLFKPIKIKKWNITKEIKLGAYTQLIGDIIVKNKHYKVFDIDDYKKMKELDES